MTDWKVTQFKRFAEVTIDVWVCNDGETKKSHEQKLNKLYNKTQPVSIFAKVIHYLGGWYGFSVQRA